MQHLRDVLARLVAKLDAVAEHPDYKAIMGLAFAHGLAYRGPTYARELHEAEMALLSTPPTSPSPSPSSEA